jgi:hypothetical protein
MILDRPRNGTRTPGDAGWYVRLGAPALMAVALIALLAIGAVSLGSMVSLAETGRFVNAVNRVGMFWAPVNEPPPGSRARG